VGLKLNETHQLLIGSFKKLEYNESFHQLFVDFKKAYDSVRSEVLYNILIEFGVPMKLVGGKGKVFPSTGLGGT
jgi:hypothetical protein